MSTRARDEGLSRRSTRGRNAWKSGDAVFRHGALGVYCLLMGRCAEKLQSFFVSHLKRTSALERGGVLISPLRRHLLHLFLLRWSHVMLACDAIFAFSHFHPSSRTNHTHANCYTSTNR
jgi:hypothetical protein